MSALPPFRGVRTRLLLVVVGALAVSLGVATIGFNVLLAHAASRDANTLLRARASSELALLRVEGNTIKIGETRDDPLGDSRVWIFRGTKPVEQPPAKAATTRAARSLVGGSVQFLNVPDDSDERLYAVPIVHEGLRVGTLVTGISLAPYHHTQRTALLGSLTLFLVLLSITGVAAWWLLRSALRPVARMTEQAGAWSEQDLDRRFALGVPHDELTQLASTLDGLLDRLAASLRHERRFSAEMSHELRTPLAKLMAEAELALRRERSESDYRESLQAVLANAQQIERIVETLVAAAQHDAQPQGVANALDIAEAVVAAHSHDASTRGVDLELVDSPERVRVGVDQDLAERILHPVVENALRYGRGKVQVRVTRNGSAVLFAVDDDGPGVLAEEYESIFEPAVRGSAGRSSYSGAGLGLALARRLARAVSGDVEARPGASGHFVVRLPAA
ncbi:MAG: two-component system, OmpR family, sensor kinase [Gaiellaceae bacterium]|nr:two-component system, OmpR family, sensor kinase [Gaiellaceae bacterium]